MKTFYRLWLLALVLISLSACNTLQQKAETQDDKISKVISSEPHILPPADKTDAKNETEQISQQEKPEDKNTKTTDAASQFTAEDDLWDIIPHFFQLESVDNRAVQRQVRVFLKDPQYLYRISKRAEPFLFFIFDEIKERGLPAELAFLPIVESAYRSYAYSSGQAAGLWQFIPSTGKAFGLTQNWWYDGRRDVYASTHAALDYLTTLNERFDGDWLLALAAYNAGSGTVNKAIRKNIRKSLGTSFWDLKLPRETTAYVPKLLALKKIFSERLENKQQQVKLNPIANQPVLQYIELERQIDLTIAAEMAEIDLQTFYQFNPAFNKWATNPQGPHHLFLPAIKGDTFNTNITELEPSDWMRFKRYQIKSGDTLSTIARQFKLSIKAIKQANQLGSNRIRAGKYLLIPGASSADFEQYAKLSHSHQNKIRKNKKKIHVVRPGESFWSISRKYNISYQKLASLNGLSSKSTLSIGQKLKVWFATASSSSQDKRISYRVRKGDSLYRIARKFNVSINQVAKWNGLSKRKYLKPGQELTLYVASGRNT